MRCVALHFFSKALLGISSPRRCSALLFRRDALPFFSFPVRRAAYPARCCAFLLRRGAARFFSPASHSASSPKRCCAFLIRRVAGASIAAAMPLTAFPSRCFTLRFQSGAFHCFALPRFALTKRTAPMHCAALLLRSASSPSDAHTLRSRSVPLRIQAPPFRRLSARTIACAVQSLVKNCPTQPSALRGRPFAQGAGWLIMVRMRWRSASGFSVPCSTTTSS